METSRTVDRNYLLISVSRMSAAELAMQYNFSDAQNRQLAELLRAENAGMCEASFGSTKSLDVNVGLRLYIGCGDNCT